MAKVVPVIRCHLVHIVLIHHPESEQSFQNMHFARQLSKKRNLDCMCALHLTQRRMHAEIKRVNTRDDGTLELSVEDIVGRQ